MKTNSQINHISLNPIWQTTFLFLSLYLYWVTRDAGFVTDWFGWETRYAKGSWSDILTSFGYNGLQPVLHAVNFTLFKWFGTKGWIWYLIFAGLHGINAWQVTSLTQRLLSPSDYQGTAVIAGLLFLLSPYAAEAVVWRVCLHYLLAIYYALKALHATLDYLQTSQSRYLVRIQVFFLLGLFSLEWSLVVPGLIGCLLMYHQVQQRRFDWQPWALITGIQAGMIGAYFFLNKWVLGAWVGHYGAATHLSFKPMIVLGNMLKYAAKNLLFLRYWKHAYKEQLLGYLDNQALVLFIWAVLLGLIGLGIFRLFKSPALRTGLPLLAFAWFFIALLPVINLFFYYIDYSENDRYGYLSLPFFWMGATLLLNATRRRWLMGIFAAIALIISFATLRKTTNLWKAANEQYRSLIQDFRWDHKDQVLVLGIPDNYQGVYMFRVVGEESGLKEALEIYRKRPYQGQMADAFMYNAISENDALKASVDSSGMIYHASFVHDGSWFWWGGIGATDRTTPWFSFVKKEWHSEITLKEKGSNMVAIYPVNGKWMEVTEVRK